MLVVCKRELLHSLCCSQRRCSNWHIPLVDFYIHSSISSISEESVAVDSGLRFQWYTCHSSAIFSHKLTHPELQHARQYFNQWPLTLLHHEGLLAHCKGSWSARTRDQWSPLIASKVSHCPRDFCHSCINCKLWHSCTNNFHCCSHFCVILHRRCPS